MDFKRFVSYIYRYDGAQKLENSGFAKVELNRDILKIRIHVRTSGNPQEVCQVYLFVREDEKIAGILIGEGRIKNRKLECDFKVNGSNIMNQGVSFSEIGGILLKTGSGLFYTSSWDDDTVDTNQFVVYEGREEQSDTGQRQEEQRREEQRREEKRQEEQRQEEQRQEEQRQEIKRREEQKQEEQRREEQKQEEQRREEQRREEQRREEQRREEQRREEQRREEQRREEQRREEQRREEQRREERRREEQRREEQSRAQQYVEQQDTEEWTEEILETAAEKNVLESVDELQEEESSEVIDNKEEANENNDIIQDNESDDELNENIQKQEYVQQELEKDIRWDRLIKCCAAVRPFKYQDEGIYIRIEPKELWYLPKKEWVLGSNSFLLHGYYSYRYLILGKYDDRHYILGVPGRFYRQEQEMAKMFGFEQFRPVVRNNGMQGQFGYWCTDIVCDNSEYCS